MKIFEEAIPGIPSGARCLAIAPGPNGLDLLTRLRIPEGRFAWTFLYEGSLRMGLRSIPWANFHRAPSLCVEASAARLPFGRGAFSVLLSLEALSAVRPCWTMLAEYHRVLMPDGKLWMLEPRGSGLLAGVTGRLLGPRKRLFELDEVKGRLTRADFMIDQAIELNEPFASYVIQATEKENPAEPVPQFMTGREKKSLQHPYPKGDQLP